MPTKLFLRNTQFNGIGAGYYDLLTAAGASSDTCVVNTAASGTEIQFTKTAGGQAVKFVTGRAPAGGFTLTTTDISLWLHESNMNANCGGRYRLFKRDVDGIETEIGGGPFNDGVEFGTSAAEMTWVGNVTDTAIAENERLVLVVYITNIGTMASGHTCTLTFNGADGATGDSFLNLAETVTFQSESPAVVLNTADATDFGTDTTPTLEFTGTDPEGSDVRYNVQIGVGWDVSTATYNSVNKSVGGQEPNPFGLAFKSDGTKMYIVGTTNDGVFEYDLSTAWDVSTATYGGVAKSVSAQDGGPVGVAFNSDGTKMYVLGNLNDTVYEYDLSTAWDVSTATYNSVNKSVSAQDSVPEAMAFKPDGTKMYVLGNTNDTVYEYDLSTAWDVSTATYNSVNKSVSAQELSPRGVAFKSDGTKMYIVGTTNDGVFEYDLSTAWNVSTATYNSVNKSVSAQDGGPVDVKFKPDGTKMYVLGNANDTVYEYSGLFSANLNKVSGTDAGFVNTVNGGDTDPFNSGEKVSFTVQAGDALANGTHFWRVRGTNTAAGESYGAWSAIRSFTINAALVIAPGGIASLEAFGALNLLYSQNLTGVGNIAGAEAFGTQKINLSLGPAGNIVSAEAFGAQRVNLILAALGAIASGEAFGSQTVMPGPVTLTPAAIASLEAFGAHLLSIQQVLSGVGNIAGAEAFGAQQLNFALPAVGAIPSAEAFGAHTFVPGAVTVVVNAIASGEAFGSAVITQGVALIDVTGIVSAEAFGSQTVAPGPVNVTGAGNIATAEAFGADKLNLGIASVAIASGEAFGSTRLSMNIVGAGNIASGEAFGSTIVRLVQVILDAGGIASLEAFGALTAVPGAVTVIPVGIASEELFGAANVLAIVFLPDRVIAVVLNDGKIEMRVSYAMIDVAEVTIQGADFDAPTVN